MRKVLQCIPMTKTFLSAFVQDNYYCIGPVLLLTKLELPSYEMFRFQANFLLQNMNATYFSYKPLTSVALFQYTEYKWALFTPKAYDCNRISMI